MFFVEVFNEICFMFLPTIYDVKHTNRCRISPGIWFLRSRELKNYIWMSLLRNTFKKNPKTFFSGNIFFSKKYFLTTYLKSHKEPIAMLKNDFFKNFQKNKKDFFIFFQFFIIFHFSNFPFFYIFLARLWRAIFSSFYIFGPPLAGHYS